LSRCLSADGSGGLVLEEAEPVVDTVADVHEEVEVEAA
jgi:hypothetical protein